MSNNDPRPFLCRHCKWIIGESFREANKITTLRVYRQTRSPQSGIDLSGLAAHKKYAASQIHDCIVECEHCGCGTPWFANQTAIAEMLTRKNVRRSICAAGGSS